ncbi:type II toxin-antitoxin system PemK/MazF family toxin [Candidatus Saccharibacteria bacterium]|nr:type II toxin-antitoxin system PemK/MazF family toxin [Candidatus Saccharibacteria bacterium]
MTDSAGDSLTLSSPVGLANTSLPPEKRFDEWNALKKIIDSVHKCKLFREREIWWYFAGENIGHEVSGKGPKFLRPILVVRKYGSQSFFGVPLSSKSHFGIWYTKVVVRDALETALLSQSGSFSANRLFGKICRISEEDFGYVLKPLGELLFKK